MATMKSTRYSPTATAGFGSAASFGDSRIRLDGLAPINLAEEVQLFDSVRTRYDGCRFWFDELDMRHDPAIAAYLRSALNDQTDPGDKGSPKAICAEASDDTANSANTNNGETG